MSVEVRVTELTLPETVLESCAPSKRSVAFAYAELANAAASLMQRGVAWQFYAMAIAVGVVQGGVQGLSRSLFASMIPKEQSGEFFGFFSSMSKFAGILGPLLLGIFWSTGDDPRRGILAMAAFFIVGGVLLWRVDVDAGRRAVQEGAAR